MGSDAWPERERSFELVACSFPRVHCATLGHRTDTSMFGVIVLQFNLMIKLLLFLDLLLFLKMTIIHRINLLNQNIVVDNVRLIIVI